MSIISAYLPDRDHCEEASCCTEFLDDKSITAHLKQDDSNIESRIIPQQSEKYQQIFHIIAILQQHRTIANYFSRSTASLL